MKISDSCVYHTTKGKTMEHSQILKAAMARGKELHPDAPIQHHAAFANSVACLVTGVSGGYGGPSVREHAVTHAAMASQGHQPTTAAGMNAFCPTKGGKIPGQWAIEDAIALAEPVAYGPLGDIHFQCYRTEYCFDDTPEDIKALKKHSAQKG